MKDLNTWLKHFGQLRPKDRLKIAILRIFSSLFQAATANVIEL